MEMIVREEGLNLSNVETTSHVMGGNSSIVDKDCSPPKQNGQTGQYGQYVVKHVGVGCRHEEEPVLKDHALVLQWTHKYAITMLNVKEVFGVNGVHGLCVLKPVEKDQNQDIGIVQLETAEAVMALVSSHFATFKFVLKLKKNNRPTLLNEMEYGAHGDFGACVQQAVEREAKAELGIVTMEKTAMGNTSRKPHAIMETVLNGETGDRGVPAAKAVEAAYKDE